MDTYTTPGQILTKKTLSNKRDFSDELEEILPKKGNSDSKGKENLGIEGAVQNDDKVQTKDEETIERSESDISFHLHRLTKHRFIGEETRNLLALHTFFRNHSAETLGREISQNSDSLEYIEKLQKNIENGDLRKLDKNLMKSSRKKLLGSKKRGEFKSKKSKYYEKLFKDHTKAVLKDINSCSMNQAGGEYKERFFLLHGLLEKTIDNKTLFTYISQNILIRKCFKETDDHENLVEEKSLFYGSKEGEHTIETFAVSSVEGKTPIISFATAEGKIKLLPLNHGVFQTQTYQFTHCIYALAFDRRCKYLACAGDSSEIHLLEIINLPGGTNIEMKLAANLSSRASIIYSLAYRSTDDLLAYAGSPGQVNIHAGIENLETELHIEETGGSEKSSNIIASDSVHSLSFSKNEEYLLSSTLEGCICQFRVFKNNFQLQRYFKFNDNSTVTKTTFLIDKNIDLILLGTKESDEAPAKLKILNIGEKKVIFEKEMSSSIISVGSNGFDKVFLGFEDKNMKIFRCESPKSESDDIFDIKFEEGKFSEMWGSQYVGLGLQFAFNSDYFLTFHDNSTVSIWNSKNDNEDIKINAIPSADTFSSIKFPSFSPGGNYFAFSYFHKGPEISVYKKKNPGQIQEKNAVSEFFKLDGDFSKLVMNVGLIHMLSENILVILDSSNKKILFVEVPEKQGKAQIIFNLRAKGTIRAIASRGDLIAFGSSNDKIYVYTVNSAEKKLEKKIKLNPHCSDVISLAFSNHTSQGKSTIASSSDDETIKISSLSKGNVLRTLKPGSGVPTHLAFDHNDEHLAASFEMIKYNESVFKIHIFNVETGEIIFNLIRNAKPFGLVGFSSDGKFVTSSLVGHMITFNLKNQPIVLTKDLIFSVAFSPDGKKYAYGGRSDKLVIAPTNLIWQTGVKEKSQKHLKNPEIMELETEETINKVKFSNNSKWIAAACEGGVLYLKSLSDGNKKETNLPDGLTIYALSFSHDDQFLILGLESGFVNIFHVSLNEQQDNLAKLICNEKVHLKDVGAVAFSPLHTDGIERFLTGGHDGKVKLIKFSEHKTYHEDKPVVLEIEMVYKGHKGQVNTVSWSPDTKTLLSGGLDMKIIIFDRFTGAEIQIIEGFKGSIWSAAFIKGGQYIISGGEDRIIRVSDSITGVEILRREIPKGSDIWSVAIAPHDNDLVLAANDSGLYAFMPFFNTTDRLARMASILSDQEIPVKIPDDTNVLPFPLEMSRLQYSIARSNIKYIIELKKQLRTMRYSDPRMNCIYSLLYNQDTMEPFKKNKQDEVIPYSKKSVPYDAWDYCEFYSASKRNRFQRKMIKIHLMMPRKVRCLLHAVENKKKILNLIIKYFPERLAAVFDSFFTIPIYISVKEDYYNSEKYLMLPPYPSPKTIENLLNKNIPKPNRIKPKVHPLDSKGILIDEENTGSDNKLLPGKTNSPTSKNTKIEKLLRIAENLESNHEFSELTDKSKELKLQPIGENKTTGIKGENEVELKMTIFQIEEREIIDLFQRFSEVEVGDPLFKSENFSNLLEYYWNKSFQIHFLRRLLIYLIFLVLVCYNILKLYPDRQTFLSKTNTPQMKDFTVNLVVIAYLIYYLCGEFYQILSYKNFTDNTNYSLIDKLKIYISSPWNWIDSLMIITGVIASVIDIVVGIQNDPKKETYKNLIKAFYSIFLFFCWMRLLEFARGFKVTSFLIRLIYKVTKDMSGFMVVLFYMLLGFVFLSYILQNSYSDHTLWEFFKIFYYVLLGDYGDFKQLQPNNTVDLDVSFFILVGCTIIMVILMLNMLIALISESHGDVMKEEKQSERYERLHLIIDSIRNSGWLKWFKPCRRKIANDELKYFCYLTQWESKPDDGEMSKKLDDVKASIYHLGIDLRHMNEDFHKILKEKKVE